MPRSRGRRRRMPGPASPQHATIPGCARSRPLQMRLECGQLQDPEPLGLIEPQFQIGHWLRPQSVDAHTRIELRMCLFDQSARLKRAQMSTQRRRGQSNPLRQFARPARPLAQQFDDMSAIRISERRQGPVERRCIRRSRSWIRTIICGIAPGTAICSTSCSLIPAAVTTSRKASSSNAARCTAPTAPQR
jgi:hypothetical protein